MKAIFHFAVSPSSDEFEHITGPSHIEYVSDWYTGDGLLRELQAGDLVEFDRVYYKVGCKWCFGIKKRCAALGSVRRRQ